MQPVYSANRLKDILIQNIYIYFFHIYIFYMYIEIYTEKSSTLGRFKRRRFESYPYSHEADQFLGHLSEGFSD